MRTTCLLLEFVTHSNYYKYALPFFLIYSFDNDDKKSSKRHVALLTLIFSLKSLISSNMLSDYKTRIVLPGAEALPDVSEDKTASV